MEIRQDLDYVVKNFNGVMSINYMIDTEVENGIKSPQYQSTLNRFKGWALLQPEITNVDIISDRVKRLNQVLHDDDQEYYRIPESAPLLIDIFTFYEMTIPSGVDINYQVDRTYSSTRVTVYLKNITTEQVKRVHQSIAQWFSIHSQVALKVVPTGPDYMFSFITSRTVESMKIGTILAFLMISLTIAIALKSVRFGIISLIPNIIPLVITFGLWGVLVGEVGMAVASVSVIALGLIIDDTVHFISKYQYYRANDLSVDSALENTFKTVGVALLTTTLIIGAGFAVLSLSSFKPNAQTGLLTSLIVLLALVVTYVVTPFVIRITEIKPSNEHQDKAPHKRAA
ncbi:MAG: hypothetical protein COB51_08075 [Moraxellaceae bacterium]|nr:MAG: hypothetical protein COB51_08075 [Moraxellaceae bacterium]